MRLCAHCHDEPARPRSDFCSERCRGRARRRWARGLPADALPQAASAGELLHEQGVHEGRLRMLTPAELAEQLRRQVERIGRERMQEAIEMAKEVA